MIKLSHRYLQAFIYVSLFAGVGSFVFGAILSANHQRQVATGQPYLINHLFPSVNTEKKLPQKLQSYLLKQQVGEEKQILPVDKSKQKPQIFNPPASFQGKIIREVKAKPENKVVALTFDDGPWPKYTNEILEILKKNNIKATFFWIGRNLVTYPEIAKQVVAAGHAIGNHTWSHSYRKMSQANAAKEIDQTAAIIERTTNVKTTLFRPPGGILNNGPAGYARSRKYAVLLWSDDSEDYAKKLTVNTIINRVLKSAKPGGMLLMHDGGGDRSRTVQALPTIINSLKNQGYKFVTVPELLAMGEAAEQASKGAAEQGSKGVKEQGSRGAGEHRGGISQPSVPSPQSMAVSNPHSPTKQN
ncbi:polysaccharide deacetylase family protein [[Phormidium] sp. LEGE 05292]|uniref:polysaccharide deacetylase family protein n=1 Tax=[Phormidium] sp. LEGE 05292 TaxID=767427 RepID=UPI001D14BC64|nr:polysaccharide deacetylase family protein [Phormidium sp. LEGE 05292]